MTPDACGTCAGGEQCDAAGQCVKQAKCMDCAMNPNGPGGCCNVTQQQRCPGADGGPSAACCGCKSGECACSDKCTPKCGAMQCGDGGCPMTPNACGTCAGGEECNQVGKCVKHPKCMDCAMNRGAGGCCNPTKGERCPGAPGFPSIACCNCTSANCAC
jgi:hypothetical protein